MDGITWILIAWVINGFNVAAPDARPIHINFYDRKSCEYAQQHLPKNDFRSVCVPLRYIP